MSQTPRRFITVEPVAPRPAPRYIVVEHGGDVVVSPQGPGKYEDSSCTEVPCAPVIFTNREQAEKVADAFYVSTVSFFSAWHVKQLPEYSTAEGLELFLLPELSDEAERMMGVYGDDFPATLREQITAVAKAAS